MYHKIVSKLDSIAQWTVLLIATAVLCLVTVMSFLYCFDGRNTKLNPDNPWMNLLAVILFFGLVWGLGKILNPLYQKAPYLDKILLMITVIWACTFSYCFVTGAKVLPSSDAKSVYDIAVWMTEGNMRAVVPQGSYLSL